MLLAGSNADRSAVIIVRPERPLPPGAKVS
jgi:hypothetical protein